MKKESMSLDTVRSLAAILNCTCLVRLDTRKLKQPITQNRLPQFKPSPTPRRISPIPPYLKTPPTPAHPNTNPLKASLNTPPPNQTSLHAPFRNTNPPRFPSFCIRTAPPSILMRPSISPPLLPGKKAPAPAPEERCRRTAWKRAETRTVPVK